MKKILERIVNYIEEHEWVSILLVFVLAIQFFMLVGASINDVIQITTGGK